MEALFLPEFHSLFTITACMKLLLYTNQRRH